MRGFFPSPATVAPKVFHTPHFAKKAGWKICYDLALGVSCSHVGNVRDGLSETSVRRNNKQDRVCRCASSAHRPLR